MKLENRQALYASLATISTVVGGVLVTFSHSYQKILIGLVMCAVGGAVYFRHFKQSC